MRIPLPIKGVMHGMAASNTPTEYSEYMNNIRPRDVLDGRIRIGQRPGLKKLHDTAIAGETQPIRAICSVKVIENLEYEM